MTILNNRLIIVTDGEGTEQVFGELFDEVVIVEHQNTVTLQVDEGTTVLFEGGTDIDPKYYSELKGSFTQKSDYMRDNHESALFYRCSKHKANVIGICRGAQLACVLSGGRLIQHVNNHGYTSHLLATTDGEVMAAASDHHQMMFPWGGHLKAFNQPAEFELLAWSDTKRASIFLNGKNEPVILPHDFKEPEVVWFPSFKALAIQPHPEWMDQDMDFPNYCRGLVQKYILGHNGEVN